MSEDRERLKLIIKAFEYCGQVLSRAAVKKQFRYETGRNPEEEIVAKVMQKAVGKVAPSVVVKEEGPAPLWSDIHGLTKSGIDGMVVIALDIQSQIKALEEQLKEVKAEVFGEMERASASRVRMEDGSTVNMVKPEPYPGAPKREKLVQLGVAEEIIDRACDMVKPKAYVKIAAGKGE